MFGLLARPYFNKFNCMLIINTDDDLGKGNNNSKLLNSNVVRLAKTKSNWYDDGIVMLERLAKNNITVKYMNRSGDGTFQVYFQNSKI